MTFDKTATTRLGDAVEVTRYRHKSGLGVILCPDASAPLISLQMWYRVGSADERPGQSGVAHLFEHLMWGPTARRGAGEFDRLIEGCGGDCNAATWVDWTYYRDTVPPGELALALDLEADRMTNLVLDGDILEAEREVVMNERLERVEDDVDGFLDEELTRLAFQVHPYGRPTIGLMDDIRRLDLPTVQSFYRRYYAPNNATLIAVGDFDAAAALAAIDDRFAALAPAALPIRSRDAEPPQDGERRLELSKPAATPRLLLAYQVPGQRHPDWPALESLAALLSAGQSSRLYRQLVVEREIATYVDVEVLPLVDVSLLRIAVGGTPETTAAELEAETDRVIDELLAGGVEAGEVEKVRAGAETDFWLELETADGKGEAFGHFESALGDFRQLLVIAERLRGAGAAELEAAARSYLDRRRRAVVWGVPA
jgi:zinc protease